MSKVLRVLLVEDEQDNLEIWNYTANLHNADAETHGFAIETIVATSVDEAKSAIERQKFDAAVVDLRLQGNATPVGHEEGGNLVIKKIIKETPAGVVIFSGQGGDAANFDVPQVKVINRGDGLPPVFEWLRTQSDLLLHLREVRKAFDEETARIFFKSIWPRWQQWTQEICERGVLSKLVTRHVIAHAHDSMLFDGGEEVHPEETYFVPPLKARLDTGDIVELDDETWIVVTPRCDMAIPGKTACVVLAKCKDISARWRELCAGGEGKRKEIARLFQHENQPKQHFLPQFSDHKGVKHGPWFAQFNDLRILDAEWAKSDLPKKTIASLTPQFIPSLTERFGSYFSRIGTPNFST